MLQRNAPETPRSPGESDSGSAVTTALVLLFQESFNILDCGIYRVISRRGSQSEEETSSLINHSMSEEERLKEFGFTQEEDQVDHGRSSCVVALSLYLTVCKLPLDGFILRIIISDSFSCILICLICTSLFNL